MAVSPTKTPLPLAPPEAVQAVIRAAEADADAVADLLDAAGFRAPQHKSQSCRLPARVLLGFGVALRMHNWESDGITLHRKIGLPTGKVFLKTVCAGASEPPGSSADIEVARAWNKVIDLIVNDLAWEGPALMGGEVLVDRPDNEELFLDALAQLIWTCRHQGWKDEKSEIK